MKFLTESPEGVFVLRYIHPFERTLKFGKQIVIRQQLVQVLPAVCATEEMAAAAQTGKEHHAVCPITIQFVACIVFHSSFSCSSRMISFSFVIARLLAT